MDNFDLKKYIAEGRIFEEKDDKKVKAKIKKLEDHNKDLDQKMKKERSMDAKQQMRNTVSMNKEAIAKLKKSLKEISENMDEDYNDVIDWDWEYISINSKGDVDVPCVVNLDHGSEPCHVHLSTGELSQYGINVEGKEPVELTDGETDAILDMVESKIQAKY
jgi:hypothetical protein